MLSPLRSRKNVCSPNKSLSCGITGWSSGMVRASNWPKMRSTCADVSFIAHSLRLGRSKASHAISRFARPPTSDGRTLSSVIPRRYVRSPCTPSSEPWGKSAHLSNLDGPCDWCCRNGRLSRISMSGIPGCSVARNTNLTGCSPKRWRSCPASGDSWPTHSSTTTRSMRFMSGLADHPGVGSVGPSHHAGRHTPSMFSPLRYCVFGSLYRPSPDDLPSRLRLEYCWLLCERIDAAPLLCGGLLDDNEFGESGHKEGSRFLELFVAYLGKRLDDALDVLPRHIVRMLLSDSLNELRLRHQLGHVSLPI